MKRLLGAVVVMLVAVSCAHAPKPQETTVSSTPVAAPKPAPKPQLEATAVEAPGMDAAKELDEALRAATVFFAFDRDELQPDGQQALQRVADVLRKHKGLKIRVEGNCDERGTEEYNLALGHRRAAAAAKYLRALGVDERQLDTVSYGALRPAVDGHDETAWAKNRRDDVKRD